VVADLSGRMQRRLQHAAPATGLDNPFRHCIPSLPYDVLVERQRARAR
jgi:hypothetical protein